MEGGEGGRMGGGRVENDSLPPRRTGKNYGWATATGTCCLSSSSVSSWSFGVPARIELGICTHTDLPTHLSMKKMTRKKNRNKKTRISVGDPSTLSLYPNGYLVDLPCINI